MKAGPAARLLAPLAVIACALAVFAVLVAQDDKTPSASKAGVASEESSAAGSQSEAAKTSSGPMRSSYTVKAGDSFSAIAEAQGVDITTLQELNPEIDPRALQPGQRLKLKE